MFTTHDSRNGQPDYGSTSKATPIATRKHILDQSTRPRHHARTPTHPLYYSTRKKPRRWPLVLRFIKGAIHINIVLPVLLHAAVAALVCYINQRITSQLSVPSSTIPSLSIVVGLMLVFRNQTSYDRFWQGNQHFTTIETSIRNLTRSFLACSYVHGQPPPSPRERADTEQTVRILLSLIFAAKNSLRSEWCTDLPFLMPRAEVERVRRKSSVATTKPEYDTLLPAGTKGYEEHGLDLLIQLSVHVEGYIKRGYDRGYFNPSQASQLTVQLNQLVGAYGNMETIHLTPLPVAYLIHMRQVLALFCCVLPFALVQEMGWWSIIIVSIIAFMLYGIEAIGAQLEDPFGYGRNEIKIDAIVEDLRTEVTVLLAEWRQGSQMFPHDRDM